MKLEMKIRVLITGVCGFIPSSLAAKLASLNYEILGIDNLLTGSLDNMSDFITRTNFTFVQGDVNKIGDVRKVFENSG